MPQEENHGKRQSVLLSFKFVSTSIIGSLTVSLVCSFAPMPAQIGFLGSWVSILAGLFVSYVEQEDQRERRRAALFEKMDVPLALASSPDLFDHYSALSRALADLSKQHDPVLQRHALLKLSSISDELLGLAAGRVVFSGTETWRTVYRQLLQSPDVKLYKSVAWVKTREYWQDQPGSQDMRLNFDLVERGLEIERIVILRGELWPAGEGMPAKEIRAWIEEQYARGIKMSVVRESELAQEPDLLLDFGIYGDRATGVEDLDEKARTLRFTVLFDQQSIDFARDRWQRLSLYAKPYAELVGRGHARRPKNA